MENLFTETIGNLERIANNCKFYQENGMKIHLINEAGCLRGAMYIADAIGCPYPKMQYYEKYLKAIYEHMETAEPIRGSIHTPDEF